MRQETRQQRQRGSGVGRWGGLVVLVAVLLLPLRGMQLAHAQPANDALTSATEITFDPTTGTFTDTLDTSAATPDGPVSCDDGESHNNVWYTVTLSEDTAVELTTSDSDYSAFLEVFVLRTGGDLLSISCSPDSVGFVALAGTTYYIAVRAAEEPGETLVFSALTHGPPFQITLSIDDTAAFNSRTGTATVRGTVTCNQPADLSISGQLRQTLGRRTTIRGSFFTPITCDGETPWSGVVRPDEGAFGGGSAELMINVGGCAQFTCDNEEVTAIVQLRGKK